MVVDIDFLNIYLALVLTSASTLVVNIFFSYILAKICEKNFKKNFFYLFFFYFFFYIFFNSAQKAQNWSKNY